MAWTADRLAKEEMDKNDVSRMLDTGIDDMDSGHELPLDEVFQKIEELRADRISDNRKKLR